MSSLQKYEYFFPRKVYQCACLFQVIKESFHSGDHSLVEILNNIKNFDFFARYYEPLVKVFCVTCGDERKDCIFVWEKHLAIVLLQKESLYVLRLNMNILQLLNTMVKKRFIVKVV